MNINIHLMWDNNDDYNKWLNTAYGENACETIASVDDGKVRFEFEYVNDGVTAIEMRISDDGKFWNTVEEYTSDILENKTIEDMLQWLVAYINA